MTNERLFSPPHMCRVNLVAAFRQVGMRRALGKAGLVARQRAGDAADAREAWRGGCPGGVGDKPDARIAGRASVR